MTKVAVCMGTYNKAVFLEEMLESLVNQTFKDFKLYILNDGSTDDTKKVINKFKKKLDIKVSHQKGIHNIGTVKHTVVKMALEDKPKYIQMLDHDDILDPTFLEKMVRKIEEGFDFVVCNGMTFGDAIFPIKNEDTNKQKIERLNPFLSWIMMKASVARKYNYRIGLEHYEDWDLHIRLIRANKSYGIVREMLYNYRLHPGQFHKFTEKYHDKNTKYLWKLNKISLTKEVTDNALEEVREDEVLGMKEKIGESWWDRNWQNPRFRGWLGEEDTPSRVETYRVVRNYKSVLDCACGTCLDYVKYKKEGLDIVYKGIDTCRGLVDEAVSRGIDVELMDIEKMTFEDNSYEVVTARHILEHLPGYRRALEEMCRVAKHEVVVVFFKAPGKEEMLNVDKNLNGEVNLNTYSKAKIEETASKYGKVSWSSVGCELILRIQK